MAAACTVDEAVLSRYFAQLADKRIRRRWDFLATDITLTVQLKPSFLGF